jgi:hypothetical protein
VQQIATPYDRKLAELSATIDSTAVIAGDDGVRERYRATMGAMANAAPEAQADRAAYYAKTKGRSDDDLVGGVASGTVDIDSLNDGELPADMRGMPSPHSRPSSTSASPTARSRKRRS